MARTPATLEVNVVLKNRPGIQAFIEAIGLLKCAVQKQPGNVELQQALERLNEASKSLTVVRVYP